ESRLWCLYGFVGPAFLERRLYCHGAVRRFGLGRSHNLSPEWRVPYEEASAEKRCTNVLAADAAGGGEETHGLAITAIEREGDPHPFTVVAADLKTVGAPAAVALVDGDASGMAPLDAAGMAIEQEAVDTVVCLTLAKWETVSGRFGGYLRMPSRVYTVDRCGHASKLVL